MEFSIKHLLILVILLFPVAAYSQGSGSSDPKKEPGKNFAVTRTVSGVVRSVGRGSVVIRNSKGRNVSLNITNRTTVGKGCLNVSRRVRAKYNPNNRNAVSVTCK